MKKQHTLCAILLGTVFLACLLTGCGTAQTQPSSDPVTASGSMAPQPDDTTAPAISSDESFIVQDVTGGDYDLAATPWGMKYPFLVDYYRELLAQIRANGGDEAREADLCSNWSKTVLPDSCITAFQTPVVSFLGFDSEGNFDQSGPQLTTTVRSAELSETAALPPELLEAAFLEKAQNQSCLTAVLTVANTGKEEVEFSLNNVRPYIFVEGEQAPAAGTAISEMMSASNTDGEVGGSGFFHCTLAPGQSRDYTVLFYADSRVELEDIYLAVNYPGLYVQPAPTQDPLVFTQTGIFCALK